MPLARNVIGIVSAGILLLAAGTAPGQSFPSKPIRIVTSAVGGGNDRIARDLAEALAASLGQNVTVENHVGGVGPGGIVYKPPPDGHTALIYNHTLWIRPLRQ